VALKSTRIFDSIDTTLPNSETGNSLGYASSLNKDKAKKLLGSQEFLQDVMDFYGERDGKSFANANEAIDYFMSDRRWKNMNTMSMSGELLDTTSNDDAQNTRLARLQSTFDALPDFYEDGGDGWAGFATNAAAAVLDPVNLIGFGIGGAGAKATAAGVRMSAGSTVTKAGMEAVKREALKEGVKAGAKKGAMAEGLLEAGISGGQDIITQNRNVNLGLQDEVSLGQAAISTVAGGALGGGLGGVFGAAGAVAPNPFKGGANAITQGIKQGQDIVRADANAARAADIEMANLADGQTAEEPITPAQEESNRKRDLAARIDERAQRLESARMDEVADATEVGVDKVDTNLNVDGTATSQAARVRRALSAMLDSDRIANKIDADADLETNPTKVVALRKQAQDLRTASNNIEAQLNKLDSAEVETTEQDILMLEDMSGKAEQLALPEPENAGASPVVYDAEGNPGTVQMPDGSVARDATAQEQPDGMVNTPVEQEGQPLRPTGEEAARGEAEVADEAQAGEQPGTTREDVVRENELDAIITEKSAELTTLDENLAVAKEKLNTANTPELQQEAQTEIDNLIGERASVSESIKSATNERDAIQNARKASAFTPPPSAEELATLEQQSQVKAEPVAEQKAEDTIDVVEEESFDEVLPEQLAEEMSTSKQDLVDTLRALGFNAEYEARVIQGFGDGRTKEGRAKRREYLVDRLKYARSREILRGTLGTLGNEQKFDRLFVEAMLEASTDDPVELLHAMSIYDRFVSNKAYSIYIDKLMEAGPVTAPMEIVTQIRAQYGEEAADAVIRNLSGDNTQAIEIRNKDADDAYRSLTKEQQEKVDQTVTIYVNKLKNAGLKVDLKAEANKARSTLIAKFKFGEKSEQRFDQFYTESAKYDPNADMAPHIGTQRRQGLGSYNQNGKIVKGGELVNKAQRMLQQANKFGYHGKLVERMQKRDADGNARRLGGVATAMEDLADAQIKRASKQRMVADPLKRAEAIENAKRDIDNPEILENLLKEVKKAENAVKRLTKKYDAADEAEQATIEAKLEEATSRLAKATGDITETYYGNGVRTAPEGTDVVKEMRDRLNNLTKSADVEAAGRRKEEMLANQAVRIVRETLMPQLKEVRGKLFRHQKQIDQGVKPDLSEQEVANLTARLETISAELNKNYENVPAAERKALDEMKKNLRREYIANGYVSKKAKDEPPAWTDEEVAQMEALFGPADESDFAVAGEIVNTEMRKEAAAVQLKNDIAQVDPTNMTKAQLVAEIQRLRAKSEAKASADVEPSAIPANLKHKPRIVVSPDGIEVDVNNDFKYTQAGDGNIEVDFDGVKVATIVKKKDGLILKSMRTGAPALFFDNKKDLVTYLPVAFRNRIKAANADSPRFDSHENQEGLSYEINDWTKSETYGESAQVELKTEARDPIDQPQVIGKDDSPLNMTADNFDIPANKQLAIQIIDPASGNAFKSVRVASYQKTQSVGDILKKSSKYEYVIGTVDAPHRSGSFGAEESFRPLNDEDIFFPVNAKEPVSASEYKPKTAGKNDQSSKRVRTNRAVKLEKIKNKAITASDLPPALQETGIETVGDLVDYVAALENISWERLAINGMEGFQQFIDVRRAAGATLKRFAPNGIDKPTTTKAIAVKNLREVMKGFADDEVQAAEDFLMRVAGNLNGTAPIIKGGERTSYNQNATSIDPDMQNRIVLGDNSLKVDEDGKRYTPATADLVHEVGHWIYENALDEADKLQFWEAMGKYIDEGSVNVDMLTKRTAGNVYTNALESPAELFANQFQAWVVNNGQVNNMSIWKKVARMASALIKKLKGEDFEIDADLVPLFQKVMPVLEIDPVTGASTGGVSRFAHLEDMGRKLGKNGGEGAAMAGKQMRVLDERIIELQAILNTTTPEATDSLGLIMTLEKIQKQIYGEYGGNMGDTHHAKYEGQEGSGSTRITFLDKNDPGRNAVNALMQTQYKIKKMLDSLRAAGAYRTSKDGVVANASIDQDGMDLISGAIEATLDQADSAYEAQLIALRASKSSYDALSMEYVDALHRLSNDLILAMEKAQKAYKSAFIRNMPKDKRQGQLGIDDSGRAYLSRPSKTSVAYKRKAKEEAKKEIDEFINMSLLVQAMNDVDAGVFLEEVSVSDVDLLPAVSKMSNEEIAAEASILPSDNKRRIDLANELRNRENTKIKRDDDLANLTEAEQMIADAIVDKESAQKILKAAMDSGNYKVVRLATNWLQNNGEPAPIKPTSKAVNESIDALNEAGVGTDAANGIRHGVPSGMKDQLSGLTNRDKRVEYVQREASQRMFALIGKITEDDYVTEQDLVRLLDGPDKMSDDASVAVPNSDIYNRFRNKIRQMSAHLATGDRDALVYVADFALNTLDKDMRDAIVNVADFVEINVDELIAEQIQNGTVELGAFIDEIPRPSMFKRAIKQAAEHAVFISNGLHENGADTGVMYAVHGDMFSAKRGATPTLSATRSVDVTSMHPSVAVKATTEFLANMPKRIETAVREFLGVNHTEKLDGHVFYNVSPDTSVRGVTYTDAGEYGSGIYINSKGSVDKNYNPQTFLDGINELLDSSPVTANEAEVVREAAKYIVSLRERIALGGEDLAQTLRVEARQWKMIKDVLPQVATNRVSPVFAAIESPISIKSTSRYSLVGNGQDNIAYLLRKAAEKGLFNVDGAQILRDSLPSTFSGADMYRLLTSDNGVMVSHGNSSDAVDAKDAFANFLKEEGFDGLETDDGFVMFDERSVREVNRPFLESDTTSHLKESVNGDIGIAGEVATFMAATGEAVAKDNFVSLSVQAQMAGIPDAGVIPIRRMAKGRDLGPSDVERVGRFSTAMNYFTENSQRFRNMGAKWFGNKIKPKNGTGIYEQHDVELSATLTNIMIGETENSPSIRNLSDTATGLKRWMQRNRGLMFKDIKQPESHKRILAALRRGKGAVARLKPEERAVALNIANAFDKELRKMRDLGISVGDTRQYGLDFYVPQVWDKEAMLANPNKFIEGLTKFFIREQRRPGYEGNIETVDVLQGKANKLFHKMAESDDGVLDVMGDTVKNILNGNVKNSGADPMYRRMLVLKGEDYPDLEGFLINDLEGLLAKYFDRTVRKRVLTKEFGLNGHGLEAYKAVAHMGSDAATDILMRDNMQVIESETLIGKAGVENLSVPRLRGSREDIAKIVQEVKFALGKEATDRNRNKQVAKAILINAQDANFRNDPQFLIRVDSIVNALADFPKGGAKRSLLSKIDEFNNVLNKRPVDGSHGNEVQHKVSRSMRAFNSVSLLGYTTISSLPDMALPLIRSGNMTAFAKAWSQYMGDPNYRRMAKNVGTGIENMMHDRMVQMAGEGSQKFSNAFFNATGLTPWTNTMREVASMVGMESFKAEIGRALKMKAAGNTNSASYRTAVRYLERYGLTGEGAEHDFLRAGSFRIDAVPSNNEAIKNQVRAAMLRFTNEAIFTPNPNDVPMWAQTPVGATIFQLKSFPLMMARLSKDVISEAKNGNVKPLMYMATAGVGAGAAAIAIKDFAQARGGEDDRSMALRERNLQSIVEGFGGDEASAQAFLRSVGFTGGTVADADKALGWWVEGLLAMGGLGLFAELLYNSAAQLDNGSFGRERIASQILGPSYGLVFNNGLNVMAGITDMNESNSKERTAVRDVASRIPVFGGLRPFKEGVVDAVAGEKAERGNPWNNGFKSDW
jgi:hypothetical protein